MKIIFSAKEIETALFNYVEAATFVKCTLVDNSLVLRVDGDLASIEVNWLVSKEPE